MAGRASELKSMIERACRAMVRAPSPLSDRALPSSQLLLRRTLAAYLSERHVYGLGKPDKDATRVLKTDETSLAALGLYASLV